MAYFKCGSDGSSVEIDGVAYDGDLKLNSITFDLKLPDIPVSFREGISIVFEKELHIFYASNHYKWNGREWIYVGDMPGCTYKDSVFIHDDKLYLIGYNKFYSWDGETWTSIGTLPTSYSGIYRAISWNGNIHLVAPMNGLNTYHYMFDGVTWTQLIRYGGREPISIFIYNNQIVATGEINGSNNEDRTFKMFNGTSWVNFIVAPINLYFTESRTGVDGDYIYVSDSNRFYRWDGSDWFETPLMPYRINGANIVKYNGNLYLLGGNATTTSGSTTTYPYEKNFYSLQQQILLVIPEE